MKPCRVLAAHHGIDAAWIFARIFGDGLEDRFESGECSGDDFFAGCERALGLRLDRTTFPDIWSDIFEANDDMERLVAELSTRACLCLVSNTNQWHFDYVTQHFPVVAAFETRVLSFEVGYLKPDPRVFSLVREFGRGNDALIYIDDLTPNVRAAEEAGFHGILFRGAADLRRQLVDLGIVGQPA